MATKSQLKQYFETGKIPTQAQFDELIDNLLIVPSTNRGNKNLFFGNGEDNPYMQSIRTVSRINGDNIETMLIFSTCDNNDNKISFPLLILSRVSLKTGSLNDTDAILKYYIPTKDVIDSFIRRGLNCNTSTDNELISVIASWNFKPIRSKNPNILNLCFTISGKFQTFIFETADINIGGATEKLPIKATAINNDNARIILIDKYYIKATVDRDTFISDWNEITVGFNMQNGTIISTNSIIKTKCVNFLTNHMQAY